MFIGNKIGVEGAKSLSEMLKVNTSLISLNLRGDEKRTKKKENGISIWLTDNKIGREGAESMSEILKENTTLTSLNLTCEYKMKGEKRKEQKRVMI